MKIIPPRPRMPTQADEDRALYQTTRRQMLEDRYDLALRDWVGLHVDPDVLEAQWGSVDTSANPLADICQQLTTPGLYGRRPVVRHAEASAEGLTGVSGLLDAAGWYTRGRHLQYLTLGLGDMFVRFAVTNDGARLAMRFAYPAEVWTRCAADEPTRIVELRELRLRQIDGEAVYTWDVFNLDVEGGPRYAIHRADSTGDLGDEVTGRLGGDAAGYSGGRYPWRTVGGEAVIPYVHYQDTDTGMPWNHRLRAGVHTGTLNTGLYASYTGHCARHATGSHVIAWGLSPGQTETRRRADGPDGPAMRFAPITPGAISFLPVEQGATPGVVQVGPGANLPHLSAFSDGYARNQLVRFGLNNDSVTGGSSNPASASALMVSNESKRDMSAMMEPAFRAADLEALKIASIVARVGGLGDYPETGYTIAYYQLPRTAHEKRDRREEQDWELAHGLISLIDVYMERNPGSTRADAERELARVQADRELAEPGSPAPAPPPPMIPREDV
jgi:hypothetical protein